MNTLCLDIFLLINIFHREYLLLLEYQSMDRIPPRLERMRTTEYDDYELSDHDSMVYVPPAIGYPSKQQQHHHRQQQQQQQQQDHHKQQQQQQHQQQNYQMQQQQQQQQPLMQRQHSVSFERSQSQRGVPRQGGSSHNVHHQLSYQLSPQTDMLTHSPPENSSDHLMSYMSPTLRSSTWRGNVNI